jgi:hypothetical protein
MERNSMRLIMLATLAGASMFISAAGAQTSAPQRTPAQPPDQAQPATPAIKSINVIELNELPADTQTQVNEVVAKRSADDQQRLRTAIDGVPMAKAAIEAKGFTSRDVLIAQVDAEGGLLIVTKRAG